MANRQQRSFVISAALDNLGDGLMTVLFPLMMLAVTQDPRLFSLIYLTKSAASAVFSLLAGHLLDVAPPLRVTRAVRWVRLIGVGMLMMAEPALPGLLLCAFIVGASEVFLENATQTLTLGLYPAHALAGINRTLQSLEYFLVFFAGPLAGAALYDQRPAWVLYLAVLAYGLSMWMFRNVASPPPCTHRAAGGHHWSEGARYLAGHRPLRLLCTYAAGFCTLLASLMAVLPLIIASQVEQPALPTGLVYAANAAGFVLASCLAPGLARRLAVGDLLLGSLLMATAGSAVMVASSKVPGLLLGMFLLGAGMGAWACIAVTWRQRLIPRPIFSRVNALYRLSSWLGLCLGGYLGGAVYRHLGYPALLMGTLAVGATLALAFYRVRAAMVDPEHGTAG
ncbi:MULTISPECIES: MFS transporter [unclassified Pseudomonas]|uniref:MFS transporter n=1 Tax=unclassified Pseudomonas TaxID=196821 RepID=UPI000BDB90E7|nr:MULTISPECIES: MFS transporter [unclassified Pseudomonas]PVZ13899.1 transmembrane secretion effector [Pseudomonas sp. URIL14HWK12:I12]PVZ24205.1 transmembrane secretion effector [Pseudomonas sp. URIL14HWK12:I10]PVZ33156.1 transmembrane secretion effector [Pseudomonas sp. URIL14HWK12:I11]SNZ10550.1 Arabinose efflux permease [Pseudomonas sp. URIL14HWK12:I9]